MCCTSPALLQCWPFLRSCKSYWCKLYPSSDNHGSVEHGSISNMIVFFHFGWIFPLNHDYDGISRDRKGTEFTISHVSTARFGRGFGWHGHSISSCLRWLPSHECCATAGRGRPWYYYLHAAELEGTKWTSLFLPKTRLQNCRHSDVEADAGERKCQGGFGTWWLSGLFQSSEKQQL